MVIVIVLEPRGLVRALLIGLWGVDPTSSFSRQT